MPCNLHHELDALHHLHQRLHLMSFAGWTSAQGLGSLVDALEKTGEAAMLLKLLQRLQDADSTFSDRYGHLQKKM